ncbi:MAG: hypothetical protein KTR16_15915 [Acidiferrobacterales bacterium]|nr:hypothetical protein [Acidiferrobacterales bacterium]
MPSIILAAAAVLLQALKVGLIIAFALGEFSGDLGTPGLWLPVAIKLLPCMSDGFLAYKIHSYSDSTAQ